MMDGRLFDALEAIARRVRGSNAPFGGIQLILSGDFHQVRPWLSPRYLQLITSKDKSDSE